MRTLHIKYRFKERFFHVSIAICLAVFIIISGFHDTELAVLGAPHDGTLALQDAPDSEVSFSDSISAVSITQVSDAPDAPSFYTVLPGTKITLDAGSLPGQTFLGWFHVNELPAIGAQVIVPPASDAIRTFYVYTSGLHYVAVWGCEGGIVGSYNSQSQAQNPAQGPGQHPDQRIVPLGAEGFTSEITATDDNRRFVTYTLSQIGNLTEDAVQFRISFNTSENLRFHNGWVAAFEKGEALTYAVLYRAAGSSEYSVFAASVPASEDFRFSNTNGEIWTDISLFFEQVPGGFTEGVYITYTFEIIGDYYASTHSTSWSVSSAERITWMSNLRARTFTLQNLVPLIQNSEAVAAFNEVLSQSFGVLDNPRSTNPQILDTIALLDNELANIPAMYPYIRAESPPFLFVALLSGIALMASLIRLFILIFRKKEKKRHTQEHLVSA